jgi:hypothetical protein
VLQVEIQARKVFCSSKAAAQLPLNLEDRAQSERELGTSCGKQILPTVAGSKLISICFIFTLQLVNPLHHALLG